MSLDSPTEIAPKQFDKLVIGLWTGLQLSDSFEVFSRTNEELFIQFTDCSVGIFFTGIKMA